MSAEGANTERHPDPHRPAPAAPHGILNMSASLKTHPLAPSSHPQRH
eukprot:CAMPEP_0174310706 /NCGR_PEP_ID=MMETSP0810-20121108/3220_1 /TAXON_ID=73025 ORGANISM="Eutreptiella gymnastica-like, Strain CCMP1594" /NCGR_SAMPLE_ID=MMETSP0810 /ASSEMBLY_ACC=CAM_ASM_000659 /LENGTH=46 /DNA_ID= /DNA_START= /DNA_END= /DNA_ORIENTATION=